MKKETDAQEKEKKSGKSRFSAKRVVILALLTGLGLITFMIESLLPPLFIPGAKLGLSNIFSLAALIIFSPVEGFLVIIARTLLGAIFAGNFSALLYSFTGGIISMTVSSLLIYAVHPRISVMAVSIAAAVAHNITQCVVFVLLSNTVLMFGYLPYLVLIGIPAGAIIGEIIILVFKGIPMNMLYKVSK